MIVQFTYGARKYASVGLHVFVTVMLMLQSISLYLYVKLGMSIVSTMILQKSQTVEECASRLKTVSAGNVDCCSGSDHDGWSALDKMICVDSTWQQTTSIMKVSGLTLLVSS